MRNNIFIKLICSIPILLLLLYFIPVLGVFVLIFRMLFLTRKRYSTSIYLILTSCILFIPSILDKIIKTFKLEITIPYLKDVLNLSFYDKIVNYSKFLLILGIVSYILSYLLYILKNKLHLHLLSYINNVEAKDYEISKENDLIMKEKRFKAMNTKAVKCPYCGSDNIITSTTGVCKYCRKAIS